MLTRTGAPRSLSSFIRHRSGTVFDGAGYTRDPRQMVVGFRAGSEIFCLGCFSADGATRIGYAIPITEVSAHPLVCLECGVILFTARRRPPPPPIEITTPPHPLPSMSWSPPVPSPSRWGRFGRRRTDHVES